MYSKDLKKIRGRGEPVPSLKEVTTQGSGSQGAVKKTTGKTPLGMSSIKSSKSSTLYTGKTVVGPEVNLRELDPLPLKREKKGIPRPEARQLASRQRG